MERTKTINTIVAVLIYGPERQRYKIAIYRNQQGEPSVSFVQLPPGSKEHVLVPVPDKIAVDEKLFDAISRIFPRQKFTIRTPERGRLVEYVSSGLSES